LYIFRVYFYIFKGIFYTNYYYINSYINSYRNSYIDSYINSYIYIYICIPNLTGDIQGPQGSAPGPKGQKKCKEAPVYPCSGVIYHLLHEKQIRKEQNVPTAERTRKRRPKLPFNSDAVLKIHVLIVLSTGFIYTAV
jgi:hypothetical protein